MIYVPVRLAAGHDSQVHDKHRALNYGVLFGQSIRSSSHADISLDFL